MVGRTRQPAQNLSIRVDRLAALFQETEFRPGRPHLDPGPALDHLVRRLHVEKVTNGMVCVYLASEPVTPELLSIAENSVRTYCQSRAQQERLDVRATRREGWRALLLSVALLTLAMILSVILTRFQPLPAPYNGMVSEASVVAAWVVLWRPLELLLYGWIEPWRNARDYEKLAELPLQLIPESVGSDAPSRAAKRASSEIQC